MFFRNSLLQKQPENIAEECNILYFGLHGIHTTTCDAGGRTSLRSIRPVRSTSRCHIYLVGRKSQYIPAYYQQRILPMYGQFGIARI